MDTIDKILEYAEVEFKSKLDMMVMDLAERVQYTGYKMVGSSRVDLIFKTSAYSFQFEVRLAGPIPESEMMKVQYMDLYSEFREMKYEHLNRK
jgi:hypothetical protein